MVLDAQLTKKSHLKNMKCKFVVRCRRRLCQLVVTQKEKLIKTFDLIKMTIACPELDVMLEDPVIVTKIKFD